MVKGRALLGPPGAGLTTVTKAVPAVAMSEAGISAVRLFESIKVVVRCEPFQATVELLTKLVPVKERVKACPPATDEFGVRVDNVGVGTAGGLITNCGLAGAESPPPGAGLVTITSTFPAVWIKVLGTRTSI